MKPDRKRTKFADASPASTTTSGDAAKTAALAERLQEAVGVERGHGLRPAAHVRM